MKPLFDSWQDELRVIDDVMRKLSLATDPQQAGRTYATLADHGFFPADGFLTLSRRNLDAPWYRITRSDLWEEDINPWKEPHKLPLLDRGLLGELLYADGPIVWDDLDKRLTPDDPGFRYLTGYGLVATLPQYDNGVALNMSLFLKRRPEDFPYERYPALVWQGCLYGRGTLNMVLRKQLEEANAAIDRELRIVGEIQRSLLPAKMPLIPGLDMAAHYRTSQRAGGDYYDLFPLPDGRWGLFIADVSGHGTPAAVLMAVTHALAHSLPGPPINPGEMLTELNRRLHIGYTNESGTFVTAFYGVYDPRGRTLTYAMAGHNPPRLRRGHDVMSLNSVSGLPLGITTDERFAEATVSLETDDILILYTDGITEAMSKKPGTPPDERLFGVERLDAAATACFNSAQAIIDSVMTAVEWFSGSGSPTDDQSLLVARVV